MPQSSNSNRLWIWIYSSVGVVMTIAVCVFTWVSWQSRKENNSGTASGPPRYVTRQIPAERYRLLARFDPPQYAPQIADKSPAFTQAMKLYTDRDFQGSAAALRS